MKNAKTYLSTLASDTALFSGGKIQQYAAICYRFDEDLRPQVLLITTRETRRWSIPKGWGIPGLKPHQVAKREAWEEAGVEGKATSKVIGRFSYPKVLKDRSVVCAFVDVFAVKVKNMETKFPERGQRDTVWVSPEEASRMVNEPELKSILLQFGRNVSSQKVPSKKEQISKPTF
jgi:8-oxo-dGTP pyrophosphatase MutT (NUDIX family)